jgi:hypothetical protein
MPEAQTLLKHAIVTKEGAQLMERILVYLAR